MINENSRFDERVGVIRFGGKLVRMPEAESVLCNGAKSTE